MIKKTILFSAFAVAIAGCSYNSNQMDTQVVKNLSQFERYSAETFFDTTSFRGSSFSHDGEHILVSSDETGIYNLYSVDIETGLKQQLTQSKDTTIATSGSRS